LGARFYVKGVDQWICIEQSPPKPLSSEKAPGHQINAFALNHAVLLGGGWRGEFPYEHSDHMPSTPVGGDGFENRQAGKS